MKRKGVKWLLSGIGVAFLIALITILSLDSIARFAAERRIRAETGMDVSIGKFNIGLKTSTIHIQNFVLKNPPAFSGDSFVEMPELFIEYDRDALRSGRLHLNFVRIEVAKIHVVETKDGQRNDQELQKHQRKKEKSRNSKDKDDMPYIFDGVDQLEVTLGTAQFTSYKNPEQNLKQNLGIKNEVFKNLKTDKDFQTAAALLTLKAGANLFFNGELRNPAKLLFGGASAGKETKNVLESVSEPVTKSISTNKP